MLADCTAEPRALTTSPGAFRVQLLCDLLIVAASSAHISNARYYGLFPVTCSKRLPAFTASTCRANALTGCASLQHDHRAVVFGERAHNLTHKFSAWIIAAQVRFHRGYQRKALLLHVLHDGLLNQNITSDAVQFLNDDGSNALLKSATIMRCKAGRSAIVPLTPSS